MIIKNDEARIRLLKRILVLLGILIFGVAGALIFFAHGYSSDRKTYNNIRDKAFRTELGEGIEGYNPNGSGARDNDTSYHEGADIDGKYVNGTYISSVDFDYLYSVNEDTAAWITAADGLIDGPVVTSTDDEFYLKHRFDKSKGSSGTFFVDRFNVPAFGCPVTVIYGHNQKDGSMFAPLLKYKDAKYAEENDIITVYLPDCEKEYAVISAFYADYDDIPWTGERRGDDNEFVFEDFIKTIGERSLYETDAYSELLDDMESDEFEASDYEILALCTCEYSGYNNRMMVYGIYKK